jgi:hypothetical protein
MINRSLVDEIRPDIRDDVDAVDFPGAKCG